MDGYSRVRLRTCRGVFGRAEERVSCRYCLLPLCPTVLEEKAKRRDEGHEERVTTSLMVPLRLWLARAGVCVCVRVLHLSLCTCSPVTCASCAFHRHFFSFLSAFSCFSLFLVSRRILVLFTRSTPGSATAQPRFILLCCCPSVCFAPSCAASRRFLFYHGSVWAFSRIVRCRKRVCVSICVALSVVE